MPEYSVHGYINSYLVMLLQGIFISMSCSHWDKVFFFTSNHKSSRKTKLLPYTYTSEANYFLPLCNITSLFGYGVIFSLPVYV